MNDYKELIGDLTAAANRNSNSLNTRDTCRKAADVIEQLVRERDAAIADLDEVIASTDDINWCLYCEHREADGQCHHLCVPCSSEWGWEWRGVEPSES